MVAVPSADQDQPFIGEPQEPAILAAVRLSHRWTDRSPRQLDGKTLIVSYRVLDNGAVTRQLVNIVDRAGFPVPAPRRTFPGLNWDEEQEHGGQDGTGAPVVLKVADRADAEAALLGWLESVGLKPVGDD
jgi:hypothetical protein